MHVCTHSAHERACAYTQTCTHTQSHTHIHTHAHMHTRNHIHTHTQAHTTWRLRKALSLELICPQETTPLKLACSCPTAGCSACACCHVSAGKQLHTWKSPGSVWTSHFKQRKESQQTEFISSSNHTDKCRAKTNTFSSSPYRKMYCFCHLIVYNRSITTTFEKYVFRWNFPFQAGLYACSFTYTSVQESPHLHTRGLVSYDDTHSTKLYDEEFHRSK